MTKVGPLLFIWLFVTMPSFGQATSVKSADAEPALPVVDYNACPFEGCTFGKWIVAKDTMLFSAWREGRKPVSTVRKDEIVTGLTGVHITYEPDRISVLHPIPELHLQPGDVILRYMYRGEGFADIWAKGQFHRQYDCSFLTEKDNSGCLRDCSAKVISEGRKDWWVRVRTSRGLLGWTIAEEQFDCMDSLGGDPQCDDVGAPPEPVSNKPTDIDEARMAMEGNQRTPEGKAYDQQLQAEFSQKHLDTIPLCRRTGIDETGSFWMLLRLAGNGRVKEVLLYPTTKLGTCAREVLLQDSFSPPPRPNYWVGVHMNTDP